MLAIQVDDFLGNYSVHDSSVVDFFSDECTAKITIELAEDNYGSRSVIVMIFHNFLDPCKFDFSKINFNLDQSNDVGLLKMSCIERGDLFDISMLFEVTNYLKKEKDYFEWSFLSKTVSILIVK